MCTDCNYDKFVLNSKLFFSATRCTDKQLALSKILHPAVLRYSMWYAHHLALMNKSLAIRQKEWVCIRQVHEVITVKRIYFFFGMFVILSSGELNFFLSLFSRCLLVDCEANSQFMFTGGFGFPQHTVYAEYWSRIGVQPFCDVTNHACGSLCLQIIF